MADGKTTVLPILKANELDRGTLRKLYERLDLLIDFRGRQDTSVLSYLDGLHEMQIELMHLLEGCDV